MDYKRTNECIKKKKTREGEGTVTVVLALFGDYT